MSGQGTGPTNEDGYPLDWTLELTDYTVACNSCRHRFIGRRGCDAFPDGNIPLPILRGDETHRIPYPNDRGVQYEPAVVLQRYQ